jgi:polar amino acid transport system substrate-binding protein
MLQKKLIAVFLRPLLMLAFILPFGTFAFVIEKNEQIFISIASPEIPPFIYLDSRNKPQGPFIDKVMSIQSSHITIKVHIMPWARAIEEVKKGRVDAIMPTVYSAAREKYLSYPQRSLFLFNNNVIVKQVSDNFVFKDFASIETEKHIGVMRSTVISEDLKKAQKAGKISTYETLNIEQAMIMLTHSRLDLVIGDSEIINSAIVRLKLKNEVSVSNITKSPEQSFLAFSKSFAKKHNINEINELIIKTSTLK